MYTLKKKKFKIYIYITVIVNIINVNRVQRRTYVFTFFLFYPFVFPIRSDPIRPIIYQGNPSKAGKRARVGDEVTRYVPGRQTGEIGDDDNVGVRPHYPGAGRTNPVGGIYGIQVWYIPDSEPRDDDGCTCKLSGTIIPTVSVCVCGEGMEG